MQALTQVGACNHCGACCYITFPDKIQRICPHYNINVSQNHCRLGANRPPECKQFPRGPMDLERVAKWCTLKFVDEQGRIVDGYQDKRVSLTRI